MIELKNENSESSKNIKSVKNFFPLDLFSHSLGENCLLLQKVCHKLFEGGGHKCLSTFFLSLLTPHTLTLKHSHHIRQHTYTHNRALPHSNTEPCLLHARSQTQHTLTNTLHADSHSLIFKSINQLINTNPVIWPLMC